MNLPTITEGDTIRSCRKHVAYYKIVYFHAIVSMLIAGGMSWVAQTATMNGESWAKMLRFDHMQVWIFAALQALKDLQAFLSKEAQRLEPAQPAPAKIPDMPVTPSARPPGQI